MTTVRATLGEGGRLLIPAHTRKALGFEVGDEVILEAAEGELRVRSFRTAVARAQQRVRKYVPEDVSLSEELIAERRRSVGRR